MSLKKARYAQMPAPARTGKVRLSSKFPRSAFVLSNDTDSHDWPWRTDGFRNSGHDPSPNAEHTQPGPSAPHALIPVPGFGCFNWRNGECLWNCRGRLITPEDERYEPPRDECCDESGYRRQNLRKGSDREGRGRQNSPVDFLGAYEMPVYGIRRGRGGVCRPHSLPMAEAAVSAQDSLFAGYTISIERI